MNTNNNSNHHHSKFCVRFKTNGRSNESNTNISSGASSIVQVYFPNIIVVVI